LPSASVEEAHLVDMMWLGPRNPNRMETSLASVPIVEVGIAYALHSFSSRCIRADSVPSVNSCDPPPDPIRTPIVLRCSRLIRSGSIPASVMASTRRRDGQVDGARYMPPFFWLLKNGVIEILHFSGDLNMVTRSVNLVMRRKPLCPRLVAFQKASRPIPFGLTAPIPFTITRRLIVNLVPIVLLLHYCCSTANRLTE
jgi:hypothetical protein